MRSHCKPGRTGINIRQDGYDSKEGRNLVDCRLHNRAHRPHAAAQTEALALSVVATDTDARVPASVWLGITNGTDEPVLICVSSFGVSTIAADGANVGTAEGFSPHACVNEESYTLVLPHETTYQHRRFPKRLQLTEPQQFSVRVDVETKRFFESSRSTQRELSWTGTAKDTKAAIQRLAQKPK